LQGLDLTVLINGVELEYLSITSDPFEFKGMVLKDELAATNGVVRVEFRVDKLNERTDNGVTREVGLALDYVRFEFVGQLPLPARLEFDVAYIGEGWFGPESDGSTSFHWMNGTKSTIALYMPATRNVRIQIRVNALTTEIVDSATMTVNGEVIPLSVVRRDSPTVRVLRGNVSKEVLAKTTKLTIFTFEVSKAITPNSIDSRNGDQRQLGLFFDWMRIDY
jgi:hypothetical protein